MAQDSLAEQRRRLEAAICGPDASLPRADRENALHAPASLPGARGVWAGQVALDATQVSDADVAALRAEGLDDRAIFELTAAAAVGEAGRRLDAALAALTAKES